MFIQKGKTGGKRHKSTEFTTTSDQRRQRLHKNITLKSQEKNVMATKENSFQGLSNKLASLVYSKTNGYKQELNTILDEFNSINFESCPIDNPNRALLVINHLCNLVPPEEKDLTEKTCSLFESLVKKKQIQVEGKTFSLAFDWCLECLKSDVNVQALKCLRTLVENDEDDENGKEHGEKLTHEICCALKRFADKQKDQGFTLTCLKCIRSMIEKYRSEKIARQCLVTLEEYLYALRFSPDETIAGCRCVASSLKGLCAAVRVVDDPSDRADDLLGIAKGYAFYGLTDFDGVRKLYPSRITLPAENSSSGSSKSHVKKLKGKYDRKSKKVNVACGGGALSSEENEERTEFFDRSNPWQNGGASRSFLECRDDSDLSDSETEEAGRRKKSQSKARLAALALLASTAKKIGPKCFVCYLAAFLPDGLGDSKRTLISCATEDPSPQCRFEAVGILSSVVSDSKPYFRLADRPTKSSFTSLACGIGHIIVRLHKSLAEAIESEKSVAILARLLKCASNLIRCTPYYKLEPGLIEELSRAARPMLRHKDVNVRISTLNLFGCLVSIEPKIEEARSIVLNPSDAKEESWDEGESEGNSVKKLWLFETCLENVKDEKKSSNTALVIESLQVLGALVQNFFAETLLAFPKEVIYVLDYCSKRSEYPVKLYSGKLVEIVFNSLQYRLVSEEERERPSESVVTEVWDSLLKGPVTKLIQSEGEPMLKCTGCDCLANVGVQINGANPTATTVNNSFIFDLLERDKQILCIAYLFGCVKDDAPPVRSSALRALAVFVLFPSLREDGLFVLDAIDAAVSASKDGHPNVRMQCAWLLGNISEALVRNRTDSIDDGVDEGSALLRLLECCIQTASDSPKCRPGALRAIGNLLSVFDEKCIDGGRVDRGIDVLLKNAVEGSFTKARWNSCYALANVLCNPRIHRDRSSVARIFAAATELVEKDKNFKVRIGAGRVLSVPPDRSCYGDMYRSVWTAVFRALDNSKNMTDYSEFQHRDQLIDQLCLVACHLIGLMDREDLFSLKDNFLCHVESFRHHMKSFRIAIVPEKSGTILKAFDRITEFKNDPFLKQEQKRTLEILNDIFTDFDGLSAV